MTVARLPPALAPPTAILPWVDAELRGVIRDPARGRIGIVDGGGKLVLGGEAIVDGDGDTPGLIGQRPAGHVVAVEIAEHPASAVKEHEGGKGAGPRGPVDAHGNVAGRAGNGAVHCAGHRRALGHVTLERLAGLGHGKGVGWSPPGGPHLIEDGFHLGIGCHGVIQL